MTEEAQKPYTMAELVAYASTGQVLYRDTMLTGFGLRVGARSKVYFVEGQVSGQTRRASIGRADQFAPEIARKKALTMLGEMSEGRNPPMKGAKGRSSASPWQRPSSSSSLRATSYRQDEIADPTTNTELLPAPWTVFGDT